jgi:hypothetical protein
MLIDDLAGSRSGQVGVDAGQSCSVGSRLVGHRLGNSQPGGHYGSDTKRLKRAPLAEVLGLLAALERPGTAATQVSSCNANKELARESMRSTSAINGQPPVLLGFKITT